MWRAFLLVFLLCSTLLLSACGSKVASEDKLQEDLYNSDAFSVYREKEFKITELTVTKRQTSEEDRFDKVWVKAALSNAKAEGYLFFVMNYSLYNDGWQMDVAQLNNETEHEMKPLCGLSEEELYDAYTAVDAEILSNDVYLEEGMQKVSINVTENYRFCSVNKTIGNIFLFDSKAASWVLDYSWEVSKYEHWKTGQYSLFDIRDGYIGDKAGELNISSFVTDSFGGIISYSYTYSYSTTFEDAEGSGDKLNLVDVRNMTIADYYNQVVFGQRYGHNYTLVNANWSDIEYVQPLVSGGLARLFIGYDHIYLFDISESYDERTDTKYIAFWFEAQ